MGRLTSSLSSSGSMFLVMGLGPQPDPGLARAYSGLDLETSNVEPRPPPARCGSATLHNCQKERGTKPRYRRIYRASKPPTDCEPAPAPASTWKLGHLQLSVSPELRHLVFPPRHPVPTQPSFVVSSETPLAASHCFDPQALGLPRSGHQAWTRFCLCNGSMRRVVVTGLGAISPLGVGANRTWQRLLAGRSGIVDISAVEPRDQWKGLTSSVAGVVPSGSTGKTDGRWEPSDWLDAGDQRRMSRFAQYAVAATSMALDQSGWHPSGQADLEATGVCLGSGIGNLDEMYSTSVAFEKDVSLASSHGPLLGRGKAKTVGRVTRKYLRYLSPRFSSILPPATFP